MSVLLVISDLLLMRRFWTSRRRLVQNFLRARPVQERSSVTSPCRMSPSSSPFVAQWPGMADPRNFPESPCY